MLAAGGLRGWYEGGMSGMTRSRFGSQQEFISLIVPAQKSDPMTRERNGREILFHLSLQKIRFHFVQHVENRLYTFGNKTVS
jgi:hypothetical protein